MRIGSYEVLGELARGGMGVVFRATDTTSDTPVVLKLLKVDNEGSRRRLQREAKAMSRLVHPNVVPLLHHGEHQGHPYLVLPFIEGESLQDRLDRDGPLAVEQAIEITIQVGKALQASHALGLIHRDVKPANVLLDKNWKGNVKLTDFGLVKDLGPDKSQTMSLSIRGRCLGTPGYWPPEQAYGRLDQTGPPADVYALAALLYALLTGHPPRSAANLIQAVQAFQTPVAPLSDARPGVPYWLDELVLRCLENEAQARPSLEEALHALGERGRLRQHAPAQVRRSSPSKATRVLLSLLPTAALAVGVGLYLRSRSDTPPPHPQQSEPVASEERPPAAPPDPLPEAAPPPDPRGDRERDVEAIVRETSAATFEEAHARLLGVRDQAERAQDVERVQRAELALGQLCLRRGRLEQATSWLRQLLREEGPLFAEAQLTAAFGEWVIAFYNPEANLSFLEVETRYPGTKFGLTAGAMALTQGVGRSRERAARAVNLAREALALDPDYVPALVAHALALSRTNEPNAAAETLIKAAQGTPDCAVFLAMARLLRRFQGDSAFVAELERGRDRYLELTAGTHLRGRTRILLRRAEARLAAGAYAPAQRDYDEVLLERPFDAAARFGYGATLATHSPGKAAEQWRLARAFRPEAARRQQTFEDLVSQLPPALAHLEPRIREAVAFEPLLERRTQGLTGEARDALRAALRMAVLGASWQEVSAALETAQAAAPDSPIVALEAARTFTGRDLYPEALDAIDRARELGADPLELERLGAEVLLRSGDQRGAREAFQALAKRDPGGLVGCQARAEAALLARDFDGAARWASRALELDPEHVPSLVASSLALASSNPSQASLLAGKARSIERDLNSRVVLALLIATYEGLLNGSRAWVPAHLHEHLTNASRGAGWRVPVTRYIVHCGVLEDPEPFLAPAAVEAPERVTLHELHGFLVLARKDSTADDVLAHWQRAQALDPEHRFLPGNLKVFEQRFPGVLDTR